MGKLISFILGLIAIYLGLDIMFIGIIPVGIVYVLIGVLGVLIIFTPIKGSKRFRFKLLKIIFGLVLILIGVNYYFALPYISEYLSNAMIGGALIFIGVVYLISLSKVRSMEVQTV